eukprot:TRINITY_DN8385_c0_g1_i2.p1 TRINITY_DN8385_c0_g1~~TRINITY_DN8385_c0_g1_i2.p1  ORF type:complete len:161 (+),score=19.36 TRINITY_DN8385_c0_g1_i2:32-484(+)
MSDQLTVRNCIFVPSITRTELHRYNQNPDDASANASSTFQVDLIDRTNPVPNASSQPKVDLHQSQQIFNTTTCFYLQIKEDSSHYVVEYRRSYSNSETKYSEDNHVILTAQVAKQPDKDLRITLVVKSRIPQGAASGVWYRIQGNVIAYL